MSLTRRTVLRAAAVAVPVAALPTLPAAARQPPTATTPTPTIPGTTTGREPASIGRLADKVEAAMAKYAIPGVGLGVWYRGREYVRGFGVTSVDQPSPVTADTVFRIGSTTKTFTATAIMRLVERGRISLDRPVRAYLPDFQTQDPSVAVRITVRQLLNHSAGWQGDYFEDTGDGDDALARYVAGLPKVPQLTRSGRCSRTTTPRSESPGGSSRSSPASRTRPPPASSSSIPPACGTAGTSPVNSAASASPPRTTW